MVNINSWQTRRLGGDRKVEEWPLEPSYIPTALDTAPQLSRGHQKKLLFDVLELSGSSSALHPTAAAAAGAGAALAGQALTARALTGSSFRSPLGLFEIAFGSFCSTALHMRNLLLLQVAYPFDLSKWDNGLLSRAGVG